MDAELLKFKKSLLGHGDISAAGHLAGEGGETGGGIAVAFRHGPAVLGFDVMLHSGIFADSSGKDPRGAHVLHL